LPQGRDFASTLTRYKAHAAANDVFPAGDDLRALGTHLATATEAQRAEAFSTLIGYSRVENPFIKGDAWREGIRWAGKAQAAALVKIVSEEPDDGRRLEVVRKLGELKDPAGAGAVAALLVEDRFRGEAVNALKAMGPVAEKATLLFLKPEN